MRKLHLEPSTVNIAGKLTSTCYNPKSTSRVTFANPALNSIFELKEAHGMSMIEAKAGLNIVVVNRLLSQQSKIEIFAYDQMLKNLSNSERLKILVRAHVF